MDDSNKEDLPLRHYYFQECLLLWLIQAQVPSQAPKAQIDLFPRLLRNVCKAPSIYHKNMNPVSYLQAHIPKE